MGIRVFPAILAYIWNTWEYTRIHMMAGACSTPRPSALLASERVVMHAHAWRDGGLYSEFRESTRLYVPAFLFGAHFCVCVVSGGDGFVRLCVPVLDSLRQF